MTPSRIVSSFLADAVPSALLKYNSVPLLDWPFTYVLVILFAKPPSLISWVFEPEPWKSMKLMSEEEPVINIRLAAVSNPLAVSLDSVLIRTSWINNLLIPPDELPTRPSNEAPVLVLVAVLPKQLPTVPVAASAWVNKPLWVIVPSISALPLTSKRPLILVW